MQASVTQSKHAGKHFNLKKEKNPMYLTEEEKRCCLMEKAISRDDIQVTSTARSTDQPEPGLPGSR